MRKFLYIVPLLIWVAILFGADTYDCFKRGTILFFCTDTSSLHSSYEKPFYDELDLAGFTMIKRDTAWLDSTTYDGLTLWVNFDGVVVVPNFEKCPNGVGTGVATNTYNIVMEDSLWDDFGHDVDALKSYNSDSVYVINLTDSIASPYSLGVTTLYTSAGDISADSLVDAGVFDAGMERICLDKDSTDNWVVVGIDSLNNNEIIFGLYDGSKLSYLTNGGWTLFNRCVGKLFDEKDEDGGGIADSVFHVAFLSDSTDLLGNHDPRDTYTIKTFFEVNMHRVTMVYDSSYADSATYDGTNYWSTKELFVVGPTHARDPLDSLIIIANQNEIPFIYLGAADSVVSYLFDTQLSVQSTNFGYSTQDSIVYFGFNGTHVILDSAGYSAGDSLGDIYDDWSVPNAGGSYRPFDNNHVGWGRITSNRASLDDSVTVLMTAHEHHISLATDYDYYALVASKKRPKIWFPGGRNWHWTSSMWNLFGYTLGWLMSSPFYAPSDVTVSTFSTSLDSLEIEWSDNSSDETGFHIYLVSGGEYSGADSLYTTVGANVTKDTVGNRYPPGSYWYFDVRAYTASDTVPSSEGSDSAYVYPATPPTPIVSLLSDTSFNVILGGYELKYFFEDSSSEIGDWGQVVGTWEIPQPHQYLDITTDGGDNELAVAYSGTKRDVDFSFYFHFSDTALLATPWVEFYPMYKSSTDYVYAYIDSANMDLRGFSAESDLITNGNCETGDGIPEAPSGSDLGATNGTIDSSSAQAHGGTYSLEFTGDGAGTTAKYINTHANFSSSVTAKDWYAFSVWVYIPGGNSEITSLTAYEIYNSTSSATIATTSTTGSWVELQDTIQVHSGFNNFRIQNGYSGATTETFYIDDLSIKRVMKSFVDTTWTADYKWHKINMHRKVSNNDTTNIDWYMFLDDDTLGSSTAAWSHNYTSDSLIVKGNVKGLWFDNIYVRGLTPNANHDSVEYAIQDSMTGLYVHRLLGDTLDTLRTAEDWNTFNEWGGFSGVNVSLDTQEDSAYFRTKARTGAY